ncbi:glycosyl transferase family protein [Thermincola ferriacetica]|uniref:Glycosyl transferase family protein n=1 Tax=Thermincola ferriacetica TaxID=281456 RepID=A0A0L6W3Y0_9FIRM|nr:glycosyl transferase family protein [Thermincola ferriacetica]
MCIVVCYFSIEIFRKDVALGEGRDEVETKVLGIAVAFLTTLIMTPLVRRLAFKIGAVDCPNDRKVHCKPMPRLGGVAIFLGFVIAMLVTQEISKITLGLVIGSALIVALGIMDDIFDISPRLKLLGQIVAALVLVLFGIEVTFVTNPFGGVVNLGILSIPITLFWIVGVTNAVNLVDGLDGLAGGVATIAAFCLAVIGWLEGQYMVVLPAIILGASTIGFLKYNFHPAKIFMGDSGSMFLGYILAAFSIIGLTKGFAVMSVFVPIFIIGIPIFDTAFAIVRRFMNHQPIFKADKEHLHHCLLEKGLSHRQTVLAIYLFDILLGVSGIVLTQLTTAQSFLVFIGVTLAAFVGADKLGVLGSRAVQTLEMPQQERKYSA